VSTDAITYARHFAQNYGPGGCQWKKPIIRHEKMDKKKKEQLGKYFQDKAIVIMRNRFVYRENLGGLCSTCNVHGYETFNELDKLIKRHVLSGPIQ
ncbi:14193_t:CDS:2, partial [Racocetra persica]